jgi:hypothetical protein
MNYPRSNLRGIRTRHDGDGGGVMTDVGSPIDLTQQAAGNEPRGDSKRCVLDKRDCRYNFVRSYNGDNEL